VSVGRGSKDDDVRIDRIPPLGDDAGRRQRAALNELAVLVDLYDRAMREPLPIFCETSAAYARAVRSGEPPVPAARERWKSKYERRREDRELEHQLVNGGEVELEALLQQPPRPDEDGPGWPSHESTRFGRLACRLWNGLLAREETTVR
jgi:exodeoxyribonuclease V gamma subunit